jgi:uncharacterized membrane protein YqiK
MPGSPLFATVTFLLKTLFEREEAYLLKRQNQMIVKNQSLGGTPDGFRHNGIIYSQLVGRMRAMGVYKSLHASLDAEMMSIVNDQKIVAYDKERIKMAFVLVLRAAKTFQDIRDALPNTVAELIPECRHLERCRPEAFTLADNPKSYTQYMTRREKVDFYVAARLLY